MPPLKASAIVFMSATAAAAGCLVLAWLLVAVAGLQISRTVVAIPGALLGAMAAPPVRLPLERRDAAGKGLLIVLIGMVLSVSIVTLLGLGVLAVVTAAGNAVHAVQVRPTRRQMLFCCFMLVVTSAAALGVQVAGWVDSLVDPTHAWLLMVGLLVVMCPLMVNAGSISRRAQEAGRALEAERRSHLQVLEHAALHDPLTGLSNRLGMLSPLANAASTARPGASTAVLFLDLDGFKGVNDVHGHAAGDALLQEVGRRLQQALREVVVVARAGGDEFVVVLTGLPGLEQAQAVSRRIRAEIEREAVLPDGVKVVVGVSVGIAMSEVPCSADDLLAQADSAMYAAKRARTFERDRSASDL